MRTIIKRELLDNFKSLNFIVLLSISVIIFTLNGFVFVQRIQKHTSSYNNNISKNYPFTNTRYTILFKKPSLLMFMAEGGERYRPDAYALYPKGRVNTSDYFSSDNYNYKMHDFPGLDWAFIIKIIFSLNVLLLGYNTVSGEKESGTLCLILSNPIKRIKFLVAKYCAILITVLVPLIIGMLISLIIVIFFIPNIISRNIFLSFMMFSVVAFFYISLFIFLCLLVSSLINNSSVGLLVLLSIWLIFLIIPELSNIVSQKLSNVPGEYQITKQVNNRNNDNTLFTNLNNRILAEEFKTEEELMEEGERMLVNLSNEIKKLYSNYQNLIIEQLKNARILSGFSPMALFQFATEDITGTGLKQFEYFISNIKAYSKVYDSFVLDKVGKLIEMPYLQKTGTFSFNGKTIFIRTPIPERFNGDMSNFPKFVPTKPSIIQSVNDAMLDLSGLILWNIILAMGAFLAFNRADVR